MHWVHGLASSGLSVVQATKSACPPLLDLSLDSLPKQSATWPAECIAFNDSVLDSIRARAIGKVDVVVLSSAWQYLLGARAVNRRGELFVASREVIEERLIQGVNRLVGDGVPVVILGPPPSVGYDIGRCIERRRMHLLYFGAPSDCSISLSTYRARNVEVDAILRAPSMQSGVTLLLPEHTMCDARTDRCIVETNEAILYRDTGHLSYEGSGELVRRMNLAETIRLIAQQR